MFQPALEDAQKAFYTWIDDRFPPNPSVSGPCCIVQFPPFSVCLAFRTYSSEADLHKEGASLFLRPYQLPHRIDYGLRGTSDGDP